MQEELSLLQQFLPNSIYYMIIPMKYLRFAPLTAEVWGCTIGAYFLQGRWRDEVYFCDRRRGVRAVKGHLRGIAGAAAEAVRSAGAKPEVRSVPECRPGDHEPLPAR